MKNIFLTIISLWLLSHAYAQDIDKKPFYLPNTEIDVASYSLELNVAQVSASAPVKAKLLIKLTALKNIKSIKLHATKGSIEILEARVQNVVASTSFINDYVLEIAAPVTASENVSIELSYNITTAQLQGQRRGLFFSNSVLSIENWPYYTRRWIPSNDSPADSAKFDIKVTVPAENKVISNGLLVSEKNNTFNWKIKNSIPTYGINLVIGKYQEKTTNICIDTTRISNTIDKCEKADLKLPVGLYLPSTTSEASVQSSWSGVMESSKSVAFFSSIMGPYAFEKVGFVSAQQSFNMEYPSLITGLGANVHEIAHHWFGDSVFIGHWGDLWISEGFTTYLDGLYNEIYSGASQDQWMKTPNGQFNYPEQTDPYKIFDDKPYQTGASSVHALRVKIRQACQIRSGSSEDRQMIYTLLRTIYQKFKGKNLSTKELVNFLSTNLQLTLNDKLQCPISANDSKALVDSWSKIWFKF
jgi:aminopeptidase N